MKFTKDELFLLKLHEHALKKGNPYEPIDRYVVGKEMGQNSHAIDNIVRHLAQANFLKKDEENHVYLTQNGLNLIAILQE